MLVSLPNPAHWSLWNNTAFWTTLLAWIVAQGYKFGRHLRKTGEMEFRFFVSTGGMPSAHAAAVSALATSVGLSVGFGHPIFAVAAVFATIVMFDAQGVRRAAGQQAKILNQIVQELLKEHHLSAQKLHELLGHTRLEVLVGMGVGIATSVAVHLLWQLF
jgi:uncharacterized protein